LPGAVIRLAGGREYGLRDLQSAALLAGVNGLMVGNYLTTGGRRVEDDLQMLKDLGLEY
ncbi:MAG: biotin synthase BioB, partial [Eubacteriales bacterium]